MSELTRAIIESEIRVTRRTLVELALAFGHHYHVDAIPDCVENDEHFSVLLAAIDNHREALAMRNST